MCLSRSRRYSVREQVDWAGMPVKCGLEKELVPAVKGGVMNLSTSGVDRRLGVGKIAEVFRPSVLCIVMGLEKEAGTGLGEPGDRTAKGRVLAEGVVMDVPKVGKSAQGSAGCLF